MCCAGLLMIDCGILPPLDKVLIVLEEIMKGSSTQNHIKPSISYVGIRLKQMKNQIKCVGFC